jgi:hypothetical protein
MEPTGSTQSGNWALTTAFGDEGMAGSAGTGRALPPTSERCRVSGNPTASCDTSVSEWTIASCRDSGRVGGWQNTTAVQIAGGVADRATVLIAEKTEQPGVAASDDGAAALVVQGRLEQQRLCGGQRRPWGKEERTHPNQNNDDRRDDRRSPLTRTPDAQIWVAERNAESVAKGLQATLSC